MDKIIENIYNMSDREYDVFKFLVIALLVAIGVTTYFALQIPYKLAERERIIQEWNASHSNYIEDLNNAVNSTFEPGVIWYDSLQE